MSKHFFFVIYFSNFVLVVFLGGFFSPVSNLPSKKQGSEYVGPNVVSIVSVFFHTLSLSLSHTHHHHHVSNKGVYIFISECCCHLSLLIYNIL